MDRTLFCSLVLAFVLTPVSAKMHVFKDAGVQFWAPDDWPAEYDEDGHVLSLNSADEGIAVVAFATEMEDLEQHVAAVSDEVDRWLKDVEVQGDVERKEANGLTEFDVSGTAKAQGADVLWSFSLVVGGEKPMVLLAFAREEALKQQLETITKMNESLERILAKEYSHAGAGVKFRAPAHWEAKIDGDALTLTSERQGIGLAVFASQADEVENHLDEITKEADKWLTDVESDGKVAETEVNGLKAYTVYGTGSAEGNPVHWSITLVVGAKRPVVFCFFGAEAAFEDYVATMEVVSGSVEAIE